MRLISQLKDHKIDQKGFTLIEVILAVGISAVVLTLVYSSLFQVINTKDTLETRNEVSHEVRVIFSRINRDISNIYQRGKNYGVTAPKTPYFLGTVENENSRLVFTSLARDSVLSGGRQSDQTEISYYLVALNEDDFEEEKLYALVRRDNPYFGQEDEGIYFPISKRVSDFDINYLDEQTFNGLSEEQKTEWNSAAVNSLPLAVEINLAIRNERGEDERYSKIISIPIAY